jgi:hypothetical protein
MRKKGNRARAIIIMILADDDGGDDEERSVPSTWAVPVEGGKARASLAVAANGGRRGTSRPCSARRAW